MDSFVAAELAEEPDEELPTLPTGSIRVPVGGFVILHGAPNVGKSWLIYHMVLMLAAAGRRSLLVLGETTRNALRARLRGIARSMNLATDAWSLISISLNAPAIRDAADFDELYDELDLREPDLLVIDPLASFFAGEENSARDVGVVVRGVRTITGNGISVVVVHHDRKAYNGAPADLRGSSALRAAVDESYGLTARGDGACVTNDKTRDFARLPDLSLRVKVVGDHACVEIERATTSEKPETVEEIILALLVGGPKSAAQLRLAVKRSGGICSEAIKRLLASGRIASEAVSQRGRGGRPTVIYRLAKAPEASEGGMNSG